MRTLGVVVAVVFLGCTTTTSTSRRTLFTTTPTAPLAFAGATGAHVAGHALLGRPTAEDDNSTAYSVFQFEGGAMLRLADQRTSFGARVNIASAATGVAQPPGRVRMPSSTTAGELELQAGHDIPLHANVGLTVAASAGLVFSPLLVLAPTGTGGFFNVQVGPHLTGGFGVYGSVGGFRPYAAVTVGTQLLNSATGTFTCTAGICEDSGTVRIGALVMAVAGARFSWGTGAVEAGVLIPLTQTGGRMPVGLAFTVYLGDLALKAPEKPKPLQPPELTPPPLVEPPPVPAPPPETPPI